MILWPNVLRNSLILVIFQLIHMDFLDRQYIFCKYWQFFFYIHSNFGFGRKFVFLLCAWFCTTLLNDSIGRKYFLLILLIGKPLRFYFHKELFNIYVSVCSEYGVLAHWTFISIISSVFSSTSVAKMLQIFSYISNIPL